jgi:hypothetical protein
MNNEDTDNMETMGTNLIATESMDTMDSLIPAGEDTNFAFFDMNKFIDTPINLDLQMSQRDANNSMLQFVIAGQEHIITEFDEKGHLLVGFKK